MQQIEADEQRSLTMAMAMAAGSAMSGGDGLTHYLEELTRLVDGRPRLRIKGSVSQNEAALAALMRGARVVDGGMVVETKAD
jgi:hypothetical protein